MRSMPQNRQQRSVPARCAIRTRCARSRAVVRYARGMRWPWQNRNVLDAARRAAQRYARATDDAPPRLRYALTAMLSRPVTPSLMMLLRAITAVMQPACACAEERHEPRQTYAQRHERRVRADAAQRQRYAHARFLTSIAKSARRRFDPTCPALRNAEAT